MMLTPPGRLKWFLFMCWMRAAGLGSTMAHMLHFRRESTLDTEMEEFPCRKLEAGPLAEAAEAAAGRCVCLCAGATTLLPTVEAGLGWTGVTTLPPLLTTEAGGGLGAGLEAGAEEELLFVILSTKLSEKFGARPLPMVSRRVAVDLTRKSFSRGSSTQAASSRSWQSVLASCSLLMWSTNLARSPPDTEMRPPHRRHATLPASSLGTALLRCCVISEVCTLLRTDYN